MGILGLIKTVWKASRSAGAPPPEVQRVLQKMFPDGTTQIREETRVLEEMIRGKAPQKLASDLLFLLKTRIHHGDSDLRHATVEDYIIDKSDGRLSRDDAKRIYSYLLTGTRDFILSEGIGSCRERPVVITASGPFIAIPREYAFIRSICGTEDVDWKLDRQMLFGGDPTLDLLAIDTTDGSHREFWFDISSYMKSG